MRFANRYGFLFIKVMRLSCKSQYAEIRFGAVLFLETIATTFCRVRPEASCASSSKTSTSTPGAFQLVLSKKSRLCRCSRHDTRVHAKSQENRRIHLDGCLVALRRTNLRTGSFGMDPEDRYGPNQPIRPAATMDVSTSEPNSQRRCSESSCLARASSSALKL